ncbi:MAG: maleylacetoacetate isomerase [Steroidobacteraceae bacterium]
MLALHTYWRSSAAYRVRIALNVKGIEARQIACNLVSGEQGGSAYRQLNPQGLVPALLDGEQVIGQSLAIIEYLEDIHPLPALLPAEPLARARVRSIALAIACDIHPLNNLRVLNHLRDELAQSKEQIRAWYQHWIATGFAALEEEVARSSETGRYCCDDTLSLADVCLVPQVYNAERWQCDLAPYPRLRAINEHLCSLAAFAAARPEAQPDAR